jgi:flagellar hook capping protein FlgD
MRTVSGSNSSMTLVIAFITLCGWTAPRTAWAAWPAFGRAISTAPKSQEHPTVASDGAGGAIIVWQDLRDPKINVFAQHVLANGELDPRWPLDGLALLADPASLVTAAGGQTAPAVVPDGAGGAIVAWQDNRDPLTEIDIYAQHVLASGVLDPKWPANGLAVTTARGLQQTFTIVSDGQGGAILAWQDGRSGPGISDIFAQHVLVDGFVDTRGPADGIPVCVTRGAQEFPVAVADGIGGAIIAWQDTRDSTATGFDVYAHHVTSGDIADPAWPVNGRAVCTVTGDQGRAGITSDGLHGGLIAWTDGRIAGTFHIFAHHVLASGALDAAWPVGGRGIAGTNVIESRPIAVADGAGGAIVCWQGFTVRLNVFAQHVKATGVVDPVWPAGGKALSTSKQTQDFAEIVTDGAGGAVIAWQDSIQIVTRRVFASSAFDPADTDTGRVLADLPSQRGDPALVATGGSGAIVAWTDTRNADTDIYAMQVLNVVATGVGDGPGGGFVLAHPGPNPARISVGLRFTTPREAAVRLSIFDPQGRLVRVLESGARPAGQYATSWDLRDQSGRQVGAGLYFAKLEVGGRSLVEKVVTLR